MINVDESKGEVKRKNTTNEINILASEDDWSAISERRQRSKRRINQFLSIKR